MGIHRTDGVALGFSRLSDETQSTGNLTESDLIFAAEKMDGHSFVHRWVRGCLSTGGPLHDYYCTDYR